MLVVTVMHLPNELVVIVVIKATYQRQHRVQWHYQQPSQMNHRVQLRQCVFRVACIRINAAINLPLTYFELKV